jgi:hypothetical protein
MHHFGTAASPQPHTKTARPNVGALTGTRLFNGGGVEATTRKNTECSILPSSSTNFSQAPMAPAKNSGTGSITWGNLHVHPLVSVRLEIVLTVLPTNEVSLLAVLLYSNAWTNPSYFMHLVENA